MNKEKILDAIRAEWLQWFGHLNECDKEMRDKYYFMIGFVSNAIDNQNREDNE